MAKATEADARAGTNDRAPAAGGERLYGGLTADERRAERRSRLLVTGLELFGTDGYAYTGIEHICSEAGVTARHFYDEFGSRENLLLAIFDEIVSSTIDNIAHAIATTPLEPVANIRAGMEAFLHSMLDDPRRARIVCVEAIGVSAEFEQHRRRAMHLFADLVAEQSRTLQLSERTNDRARKAASLALVGGANELLIEYLNGEDDDPATFDELLHDLVNLFIAVSQADDVFAAGD